MHYDYMNFGSALAVASFCLLAANSETHSLSRHVDVLYCKYNCLKKSAHFL